jgi:hypothetical protein
MFAIKTELNTKHQILNIKQRNMLSFFKHIAARIWLTAILGGLASLWVLPLFQTSIGLRWTSLPVAVIMMLAFMLIGWVSNHWGVSRVERLIREAGVFERDGMATEAETKFRHALAVFDSCLISPVIKKQKAIALTARVARFYLARAEKSYESEAFLISYLQSNPGDEEVAENWIEQLESRGGLKEEHQELAYLIGTAQPNNRIIQAALARYYLLMERTDFPALQTYRRVSIDRQPPPGFIEHLARLFLREKRADEWALEVYLKAVGEDELRPEILRGIAACVRWIALSERNKPLLEKADRFLEGIDADEAEKMSAGFKPPLPAEDKKVVQRPVVKKPSFFPAVGAVLQTFYEDLSALPAWALQQIRFAGRWAVKSKKARRVLTGLMFAGLTAGVIVLVISTVGHLVKTETTVTQRIEKAPEQVTDPFTLQVAAYLEPAYAKSYVEKLKKTGLDAYWREAISANKKWYQVRVSHFADKKSARDFGESLKARGVIDDYYVANFMAPTR